MSSRSDHKLKSDEIDFLNEMIKHHEMAVRMCKNMLSTVNHHDVESIAYSIIQAQVNEIELMRQLLRNN